MASEQLDKATEQFNMVTEHANMATEQFNMATEQWFWGALRVNRQDQGRDGLFAAPDDKINNVFDWLVEGEWGSFGQGLLTPGEAGVTTGGGAGALGSSSSSTNWARWARSFW